MSLNLLEGLKDKSMVEIFIDENGERKEKETGITKKNLDLFFAQQGQLISVEVHWRRTSVTLSKEALGLQELNEEALNFYNDHVKEGKIYMLPVENIKKLTTLESCVRKKVEALCIDKKMNYMLTNVLKDEFKPYFEEKRKEFFDERDKILKNWDELKIKFSKDADILIDATCLKASPEEKELIKTKIMKRLPDKGQFANSFSMNINMSPFACSKSLDLLNNEFAEDIKINIEKQTLNTATNIVCNLLNDSFKLFDKIIKDYNKKGFVKQNNYTNLLKLRDRLKRNNILNNNIINKIVNDVNTILVLRNMEEKAEDVDSEKIIEMTEDCISYIYKYMKDNELLPYLNTKNISINIDELEMLAEF